MAKEYDWSPTSQLIIDLLPLTRWVSTAVGATAAYVGVTFIAVKFAARAQDKYIAGKSKN
jgi:ABC-type methionine transport system permease subunit